MNIFHNKPLMAITILSILMIIGCGYRFGPGSENIDKNIQKVYVDNFQNNTTETYLESYVRKGFIDQLIKTSSFKLAQSRDSADAVLKGKIKTFAVSPIAYQSNNIAAIERIYITMEISFEEGKTQKIIWSDHNFSITEDYTVDAANLRITENAKKDALVKLSNDTAERALRLISSRF